MKRLVGVVSNMRSSDSGFYVPNMPSKYRLFQYITRDDITQKTA